MKEKELKRLYRFYNNQYYIDVQLEDYRDAYSNWDYSPFKNRDLDDDLTDFLLACSYEIPFKFQIAIDFHLLHQLKDENREEKSIEGMYNFFTYKIRKLTNKKVRMIRSTIVLLVIGTLLLLLGSITDQVLSDSIVTKLIREGFIIGGWVMIWEMFSIWFFNVKELSYNIKHFERLKNTSITYAYND